MSTEQQPSQIEQLIHNGQVVNEISGVQTEMAQTAVLPPPQTLRQQVPQSVEDIDPEALAARMASCISEQLLLEPKVVPMDIVTALLKLQTPRGHKVVWTRFDLHQMFALWSNKMASSRSK